MGISEAGFDGKDRELLLGRRTYEIFEAYGPYQSQESPIARTLHAARKHVASRTLTTLHWLENRGTSPAVEVSVDIVKKE